MNEVITKPPGNLLSQSAMFNKLKAYTFQKTGETRSADWLQVDQIDGIEYYCPNDEDWGSIIAIHWEAQLACYTGFYEMDDMGNPASGYQFTLFCGQLMPKWEADDYREHIIKAYLEEQKAPKIDTIETGVRIPAWALPAIINGDYTGLSDTDELLLQNWLDSLKARGIEQVTIVPDYASGEFFTHNPVFGLPCTAMSCALVGVRRRIIAEVAA